jgi:hypothetical protein
MSTVTATHVNICHICHRELWLHANEIGPNPMIENTLTHTTSSTWNSTPTSSPTNTRLTT